MSLLLPQISENDIVAATVLPEVGVLVIGGTVNLHGVLHIQATKVHLIIATIKEEEQKVVFGDLLKRNLDSARHDAGRGEGEK
ncbi:hypothetical protein Droror1_Dr00025108 [Drosera rotundifolia]